MNFQIKIDRIEKKKILNVGRFNHSLYYKIDYCVDGKVVTQSHELLLEYLKQFQMALLSLKMRNKARLQSIGGVVDIDIIKKSKERLELDIIYQQDPSQQKTQLSRFKVKISFEEFTRAYFGLLYELETIASQIQFDLVLSSLKKLE